MRTAMITLLLFLLTVSTHACGAVDITDYVPRQIVYEAGRPLKLVYVDRLLWYKAADKEEK